MADNVDQNVLDAIDQAAPVGNPWAAVTDEQRDEVLRQADKMFSGSADADATT